MNFIWVFLSALTIIIADAIIKKVSQDGDFWAAFTNPWMLLAYAFYFLQIVFAIFIFLNKGELSIYTNLFIIFYALFGIAAGVLFFHEQLSTLQIVGVLLGITGAILLTTGSH